MVLGFDENEPREEPKDRTKWVWLGVLVILVAMVAVLWTLGRQEFRGKSVVRAKHILIQFSAQDPADRAAALKQVTEIRERILNGESFAKLAREYSDDTYSSARGGDLGYQVKGAFEKTFEEYAWKAPLGELSEPITTSHGFHLIVVVDRTLSEADRYEQELMKRTAQPETAPGKKTP